MSATAEQVKQRFQRFAEMECKEYSSVYYELAHSVALDDELTTFIAQMPDQQPNLFLAAVQYLTGAESMPTSGAEMSAFVKRYDNEVAELMRSHQTQTNEVGRCAGLLPALPSGPLALVEVGASAGLCLMLDKFHYDYGSVQVGDETSPVRLRCSLRGEAFSRLVQPQIVWRCGLDIEPVDLNDPLGVRWLLACVWPDHSERRNRLKAAIELWKQHAPPVRRGDLVDDIRQVLSEAPSNATLVVFHSALLPYVSPERRHLFLEVLSAFSKQRDIVWISNEGPRVLPHIDALAPPLKRLQFLIGRTKLHDGTRDVRLLGIAHAHGADLDWLGNGAPVC